MQVHLVDGTYELFRFHFAPGPSRVTADGQDVAATQGVLRSMFQMIDDGVTHIAVATDHVIESWRNDLYEGYKDGSGIPEELRSQFPLLEEGLELAGFTVWPMVEYEADDALAAGIKNIRSIGDAYAPGAIVHAVASGHRYARELDANDLTVRIEPGDGTYLAASV